MARLLKDLLNRTRLGESIDTYRPETRPETTDFYPTDTRGTQVRPTDCPEGYVFDKVAGRCVDRARQEDPCPEGTKLDRATGRCKPISDEPTPLEPTPPDKPKPPQWFTCPDGRRVQDPSECDEIPDKPIEPDKPDEPEKTRWCAKEGQNIPANQWTISRCESADPTPPTDPIDEEVGGFREPIEGEGGDIGDFYDRFPIDYDPSRFGDYQTWLKGKTKPKEDIFERLGIKIRPDYKEFFPDYSWFPESLAGTEFDVGRKGMTADLFDLTRQSWQLRKGQGLLSGAPREFERLGMGEVGRGFQAMDVAYRKGIYGMRKGFEEETINRLLDLMKAGADVSEPFKRLPETYSDAFMSWLSDYGINAELWGTYDQELQEYYWNTWVKRQEEENGEL